jgi:hypothetical protein
MKNYLCLFLIALIACQTLDKNGEIILKASDFINEVFETIATILSDCNLDPECVNNEAYEYFSKFTPEQSMEYLEFLSTTECYDVCYDKLSAKVDSQWSDVYCSNICSAY